MTNKQELIVEALEGKRSKKIWEFIKKVVEIDEFEIPKHSENTYFIDYAKQVDMKENRYIVIEDYNIQDDFFAELFRPKEDKRGDYGIFYESYFSGDEGEPILLIDMELMKAYYISKKIEYPKREVKWKVKI